MCIAALILVIKKDEMVMLKSKEGLKIENLMKTFLKSLGPVFFLAVHCGLFFNVVFFSIYRSPIHWQGLGICSYFHECLFLSTTKSKIIENLNRLYVLCLVILETFTKCFLGTCCRSSFWIRIGMTPSPSFSSVVWRLGRKEKSQTFLCTSKYSCLGPSAPVSWALCSMCLEEELITAG